MDAKRLASEFAENEGKIKSAEGDVQAAEGRLMQAREKRMSLAKELEKTVGRNVPQKLFKVNDRWMVSVRMEHKGGQEYITKVELLQVEQ